ncbi:coniferyl aldehyde dehydrogenase [Brenneria goodwinii]|uniref:coniferyl aldehyde dehydrogenase n=1 Tax=Brenneria goodwinii TaxID=1109412 RepID=UPI000EF1C832|nr:coniferyl aldehyde dehydrogenase [Brenneria goodwinii]MCG8158825.1 coniferyl aldehyde dehydrogenase [Brenneria goodwinii]MCG8163456.1 coniferyl aldehyde dehydrogenase [Brenneria goodwinii]MCG8167954.1 coniferyl aldehyde dehydrogenase [Brenneria goodwinii]MCG8172647.1 coniferyl aldehyde dehydrogenase [Brenneria goodwinii]MCG8177308.1 coniferyl aldehyde dehydrogenase [Brenneria goodwinii]
MANQTPPAALIVNNRSASYEDFTQLLASLKKHNRSFPPSAAERQDRLLRAIRLLKQNKEAFAAAYSKDFGFRSPMNTLISDILGSVAALQHAHDHLTAWMESETRVSPFPDTQASIDYRPLGVVGIISPWNFPLVLTFGPLADVIAAGNSAVLKPSSTTPNGSALLCQLIAEHFSPEEISTVQGRSAGTFFSAQPFDHLVFTGSTATGKQIMSAAAENLTPVTLELGGKSPVIISESSDLRQAVERILTVKTFNAGQICISPDYVLVPQHKIEEFVAHAQAFIASSYPTLKDNPDYTAIINAKEFNRLHGLVKEAASLGAEVFELNPANENLDSEAQHKMAPTLLVNVPDSALAMREEIFGPVLPVQGYSTYDECIDTINRMPRPLAAYYFGRDRAEIDQLREHTLSGALVINDALSHVLVHDIPFGGVGASGTGAYHGIEGFKRFSHARPLFIQSEEGHSNLPMRAPYGNETRAFVDEQLDRMGNE